MYKRQIIGFIIIPEGIDVNAAEAGLITALNSCNLHINDTNMQTTTTTIPDKANPNETLGQKNAREQALSYLSSVSYTHLDVYKRQGMASAARRSSARASASG